MVSSLVKRVEGTEKELKELKHMSASSSNSKKKEIPPIVRVSLQQCLFVSYIFSYSCFCSTV